MPDFRLRDVSVGINGEQDLVAWHGYLNQAGERMAADGVDGRCFALVRQSAIKCDPFAEHSGGWQAVHAARSHLVVGMCGGLVGSIHDPSLADYLGATLSFTFFSIQFCLQQICHTFPPHSLSHAILFLILTAGQLDISSFHSEPDSGG